MVVQLSLIASMAARHILADVARTFEQATGTHVRVLAMGGVEAARRVHDGEACDLVVLADDALARLAADGIVLAESTRIFARSATAIAVRAGAARPNTCDAETIKTLVAGARALGLSTGPSGVAVRTLLQSWDFAQKPPDWIVAAPPGVPVAHLLARGDVDVGFQQLSELLGEPGIDIVGIVPPSLLAMTAFSIGINRRAGDVTRGQAFIDALTSATAAAVIRRHGMEPAD